MLFCRNSELSTEPMMRVQNTVPNVSHIKERHGFNIA